MTDNTDTTTDEQDPLATALDAAQYVDTFCHQYEIELFGEAAQNNAESVYQRLGALADWNEEFDRRADELWTGEGIPFEEWAVEGEDRFPGTVGCGLTANVNGSVTSDC